MSTCCLPNLSTKRPGSSEIKCKPRQWFGCLDFFSFFFNCYSTSRIFFKLSGIKQPHPLSQIHIKLDHSLQNCKTPEDGSGLQREQRHPSWISRYVGPKKFWSAVGPKTYEPFSIYCKLSVWRTQRRVVEGAGKLSKALTCSRYTEHSMFSWSAEEVNSYVLCKTLTNL